MIIYGKDHYDRARALGKAVGNEHVMAVPTDKRFIPNNAKDPILTAWGHGGPDTFCDMVNLEFCILLNEWKKRNPALSTVEIVTCDARHAAQDYLSSYAVSIAKYMEANTIGLEIKALPQGPYKTGKSALGASDNTSSYCYISSPDDGTFDALLNRLVFEILPACDDDFQRAADILAKERGNRLFTLNSGYFSSLRATLVKIRSTLG
jgi:hypothetical protein